MQVETYLWWIGAATADSGLLDRLHDQAERVFGVAARAWHGHERPTDSFDARRQQHSSTRILKWLLATRPRHGAKILGLTDVDLFIPILTFVFGEADLGGAAALVSTARLAPDEDLPGGRDLLRARTVKEGLHQLGHTFGLIHCPNPTCVMARSDNLVQVDAKEPALCHDCRVRYGELSARGHHHHG